MLGSENSERLALFAKKWVLESLVICHLATVGQKSPKPQNPKTPGVKSKIFKNGDKIRRLLSSQNAGVRGFWHRLPRPLLEC